LNLPCSKEVYIFGFITEVFATEPRSFLTERHSPRPFGTWSFKVWEEI